MSDGLNLEPVKSNSADKYPYIPNVTYTCYYVKGTEELWARDLDEVALELAKIIKTQKDLYQVKITAGMAVHITTMVEDKDNG